MDGTNYVSPLHVVQTVSLYTCLNLLSDFLYTKSDLTDDTLFQRIPVVNGIYDYLDRHKYYYRSKMELVRIVLQGSDLYGEETDENLDEDYATAILNHIIEAFVFDRFINVQGFLVDVMRRTESYDTWNMIYMAELRLRNTSFENEFGPNSYLSNCSVVNIVNTFIKPMFFTFNEHHNIFSIDYIYAQAGLTFLRTNTLNDRNIFGENMYDINNMTQMNLFFHQCIGAALGIEQAVLTGELNETSMQIFSFSALSYYVYKTSHFIKHFHWVNVQDIITSPETWGDMYRTLFDFIDEELNKVRKAQDEDYRLTFLSALAAYQNYTSLARDIIEKNCLHLTEDSIQKKVTEYQDNPDAFSCNENNHTSTQLPNLRKRFTEQNTNIKTLYFNYEKFLINETYDFAFKKYINYSRVFITLETLVPDEGEENKQEHQNNPRNLSFYKSEPDYLKLQYPNSKVEYCILNRTNFKIDLYEDSKHPELFKAIKEKSAGVAIVKYAHDTFETFVENLANRKATELFKKLDTIIPDKTRLETNSNPLIDILLDFIPFYTCITDIMDPNITIPVSCLLDIILSIPGGYAIGKIGYKLVALSTRLAFYAAGITLRTVTLKLSLQLATKVILSSIRREFFQISQLYAKSLSKKFGIELLRLVDPGFELTYILGKTGISVIGKFFKLVEKGGRYSFKLFLNALEKAEKLLEFDNKIIKHYRESIPVYIKTFKYKDLFMFGYKFVFHLEEVGILRLIPGKSIQMPLFKKDNFYRVFSFRQQKFLKEKYVFDGHICRSNEAKTLTFLERLYTDYQLQKNLLNEVRLSKQTEATKAVTDENLLKLLNEEYKKYNFPEVGGYEKEFVDAWLKNDKETIRRLFDKYKIAEPEIFFDLKYGLKMDDAGIEASAFESRLNSIYSSLEVQIMQYYLKVNTLIGAYKKFNLHFLLKFEDFVAIRSFLSFGFQNISTSADWARRMKYAMYRLAIRQSNDPFDDFEPILYRWEIRTSEFADILFRRVDHIYKLPRFTSASVKEPITPFILRDKPIVNVIYRMRCATRYLRVSVEEFHLDDDVDVILLPGTLYTIKRVVSAYDSLRGPHVLVHMDCEYDSLDIEVWQNEVMEEIKKLVDSNTVFYGNQTEE